MDFKKFIDAFNENFGDNVFPKGFIEARFRGSDVYIRIGDRDLTLSPDGEFLEASRVEFGVSDWIIRENHAGC